MGRPQWLMAHAESGGGWPMADARVGGQMGKHIPRWRSRRGVRSDPIQHAARRGRLQARADIEARADRAVRARAGQAVRARARHAVHARVRSSARMRGSASLARVKGSASLARGGGCARGRNGWPWPRTCACRAQPVRVVGLPRLIHPLKHDAANAHCLDHARGRARTCERLVWEVGVNGRCASEGVNRCLRGRGVKPKSHSSHADE
jgi:hypothetical protein